MSNKKSNQNLNYQPSWYKSKSEVSYSQRKCSQVILKSEAMFVYCVIKNNILTLISTGLTGYIVMKMVTSCAFYRISSFQFTKEGIVKG